MRRPNLKIAVVGMLILAVYGCFSALGVFTSGQRTTRTGAIAYWFRERENSDIGDVPAEVSVQAQFIEEKFKALLVYPTYSDCEGKSKSPDFIYLLEDIYFGYPGTKEMKEWEEEEKRWVAARIKVCPNAQPVLPQTRWNYWVGMGEYTATVGAQGTLPFFTWMPSKVPMIYEWKLIECFTQRTGGVVMVIEFYDPDPKEVEEDWVLALKKTFSLLGQENHPFFGHLTLISTPQKLTGWYHIDRYTALKEISILVPCNGTRLPTFENVKECGTTSLHGTSRISTYFGHLQHCMKEVLGV